MSMDFRSFIFYNDVTAMSRSTSTRPYTSGVHAASAANDLPITSAIPNPKSQVELSSFFDWFCRSKK
jgi:hypothetical protein